MDGTRPNLCGVEGTTDLTREIYLDGFDANITRVRTHLDRLDLLYVQSSGVVFEI